MVDRLVAGRRCEGVVVGEALEEVRAFARRDVEVAADDEGVGAGPIGCGCGGMKDFFGGARRVADGGVEVGNADSGGGAGEGHDATLGRALVEDELAAVGDGAER